MTSKTRCIFCWKLDGSVPFTYNGHSYVAHPECLHLWKITKEAIHEGLITNSEELSWRHPLWPLRELAVNFFHLIRFQDRNALLREPDYLKFTD